MGTQSQEYWSDGVLECWFFLKDITPQLQYSITPCPLEASDQPQRILLPFRIVKDDLLRLGPATLIHRAVEGDGFS